MQKCIKVHLIQRILKYSKSKKSQKLDLSDYISSKEKKTVIKKNIRSLMIMWQRYNY